MSLATFRKLMEQVRQFPSPPTIHLGGYGEPMSHPDFLQMVRLAKETGARVEMTTNGTLLNADMAAALIELNLDRMVVSIDGVTPESYGQVRVNGDLRQVDPESHRNAPAQGAGGRAAIPQVGLAFVAMKRNVADLPELPRLATRVGAWTIQVSNLVPHTPEMEREILYGRSLTTCTFRASHWVADMSLPKFDLDAHTVEPLRPVFGLHGQPQPAGRQLERAQRLLPLCATRVCRRALGWRGEPLPAASPRPPDLRAWAAQGCDPSHAGDRERPLRELWESPFAPFGQRGAGLRFRRAAPAAAASASLAIA